MSNDAYIGFKLPRIEKAKLTNMAWLRKIGASELLREIVQDYLNREEKQEVKKVAPMAQQ
jgi:hypothetical protein